MSPVDIDADTSNRVHLNDDILDVLNDVAGVIPPTLNLDATATHDETIDNEHEAFGNLFGEARK